MPVVTKPVVTKSAHQLYEYDPGYLTGAALEEQLELLHYCLINTSGIYLDEDLRNWTGHTDALTVQLNLLQAERAFRTADLPEYLQTSGDSIVWPHQLPQTLIMQFARLADSKAGDSPTPPRLNKPRNEQSLWAQHKYSILARNQTLYLSLGPMVARQQLEFDDLLGELSYCKRIPPLAAGLRNAVGHLWGYVAKWSTLVPTTTNLYSLMLEIQNLAIQHHVAYLLQSTALVELAYWCWALEHPPQTGVAASSGL
jgi:hypothetical protein